MYLSSAQPARISIRRPRRPRANRELERQAAIQPWRSKVQAATASAQRANSQAAQESQPARHASPMAMAIQNRGGLAAR